jgi:hypothetical protein
MFSSGGSALERLLLAGDRQPRALLRALTATPTAPTG